MVGSAISFITGSGLTSHSSLSSGSSKAPQNLLLIRESEVDLIKNRISNCRDTSKDKTYAKGRVHKAVRRMRLCDIVKSLHIAGVELDQSHILLDTRRRHRFGDYRTSTGDCYARKRHQLYSANNAERGKGVGAVSYCDNSTIRFQAKHHVS